MTEVCAGVPAGFGSVTPIVYLTDTSAAIDFYRIVFGATELKRVPGRDGRIAHAEIRIGESVLILVDQLVGSGRIGTGAPSPRVELAHYSEDADGLFARATDLGSTVLLPMTDVFWGDRYGKVMDPFGLVWAIATRKASLTIEELQQRMSGALSAASTPRT